MFYDVSINNNSLEERRQSMGDEVARNEELESLIDSLLTVCGHRNEVRNPLFNVLNWEDLLLSIIKTNESSVILKDKTALCLEILNCLLSLSRHKDWKIVISLIKIIFESDFKEKNMLILDVWSKQELCRMPIEVVSLLLNYKPALVEKQLYSIYSTARKNQNILQNDCFHCWVLWCSESAELFLTVSSIFNKFLINLNANSVILKIISKFITNVMNECDINRCNILSLYPIEYQSFIASLMIDPDHNPYRNLIIKKIKLIRYSNSEVLLLLLSHFPLWMNVKNN